MSNVSPHENVRALLVAVLVASVAAGPAIAGNVCAASVEDKRIANAVVQELIARYALAAQSASSPKALRVFTRPGCQGNVTLDIYELEEPAQFRAVEALAREAQAAVPRSAAVSLRFFEREVWVSREGGGGHRGKEKLLKTSTLPSLRSAAPKREG